MALKALHLEHYRNFSDQRFEFKDLTAVIGHNGTGKSNLLEALRLLSVGKSFKTGRLDDAISWDKPYLRLQARDENSEKREIEFFYGQPFDTAKPRIRQLTVN